ncbi:flagellar hook-basal body complex protein FliE [Arthrobacter koreensis]|jgi:flagellar hook-basal body complex protein FliE|uniref:Flagellar hook-basal body complex protein FliE n=1 Tax=Arthrobacter koreensis TaxID=199136 RepID=A0ABY6FTL7_9MICC|nr:flagellar hook-basal body complex protein FliE [Arthrobacter koreensis]MDF2496831.1 hypothetical protein [Arthrobacter koreensis]UYB36561.1 flagellar hook-basal body complex protein FliE [Arthrobacter koreensis]
MPVPAIAAVAGTLPTAYLENTAPVAPATDGSGFATQLAGAVDNAQQLSSASKELAVQAVTGDLDDIHAATIASTRASVTLELVAAVRNKSVDAFNEIMRMQA